MFEKLRNWLLERYSEDDDDSLPEPLARTGSYGTAKTQKITPRKNVGEFVSFDRNSARTSKDADSGKDALIRNKYVREDTGTHETLKILDDSLVDSGEETGIDPYNTGGFDRSKNWSNRFRK